MLVKGDKNATAVCFSSIGILTSLASIVYRPIMNFTIRMSRTYCLPARSFPFNFSPLHLLRSQLLKFGPELIRFLPISPNTLQSFWSPSVLRRATPAKSQTGFIFNQTETAPVPRCSIFTDFPLLSIDDAPFYRVFFMFDEFLVHSVCYERYCFSGKTEFHTQLLSEYFGCEWGK